MSNESKSQKRTFTFEEWTKEAAPGTVFFSAQCQIHERHCPLAMLDPSQLEGIARHGCETLRNLAEQATHGTVFDRPENRRFIRRFFKTHKHCRMVVGPAQTSSILDVPPVPEQFVQDAEDTSVLARPFQEDKP